MRVFTVLLLFTCISGVSAQSVSTQIGGRANGMGYASAALFDAWSLFHNPAGTAKLESITTGFTYDLHPIPSGANRTAATLALPIPIGVTAISAYRFGDDLYNEHVISAGFANQFGLAALGMQVNYIQYTATGFGTKGVASINLGGIAELTPKLSIGAYIVNLNQPTISGEEKLPTRLVAGLGFKPIEKLFLAAELEKDLDLDPTWKMGMEYTFHKKFSARTGYNLRPNTAFFGLGFKTKKLTLDYTVQHHIVLNVSHQATVGYQFGK